MGAVSGVLRAESGADRPCGRDLSRDQHRVRDSFRGGGGSDRQEKEHDPEQDLHRGIVRHHALFEEFLAVRAGVCDPVAGE